MKKQLIRMLLAIAVVISAMTIGKYSIKADNIAIDEFECVSTNGNVPINSTTFPDKSFRNYIGQNFDENGDGVLSINEREKVWEIKCDNSHIKSIKGVGYFDNLIILTCSSNSISSIPSKELKNIRCLTCNNNKISYIDTSYMRNLVSLQCAYNNLTKLDVHMLTNLNELICNDNKIESLDVSSLVKLQTVDCSSNNMVELNLGIASELNVLICNKNKLTDIELRTSNNLRMLKCDDSLNPITAVPVNQYVKNTIYGIELKWYRVYGAIGYYIFRSKLNDNNMEFVGTITGNNNTNFCDKKVGNGDIYVYKIMAYNKDVVIEPNGNSGVIKYIVPPKISSITNSTQGILLKWNKVESVDGYIVYRRTSSSGWTRLASIRDTSFTDESARNNISYVYTIKSYSYVYPNISNLDDYVVSYSGISKTINRLADPTVSSASNITAGIQIKWVKTAGATGYIVYRKTGKESWSRIATIKSGSTTSYTDKSAKSVTNYSYTVRACNGSTMSDWHNYKSCKRLADPTVSSASNITAGVQVKWAKTAGATGYVVYRKTGTGSWSRLATIKSGTTTSYTDKSAKSGTNYSYTVRACNGSTMSDWHNSKAVKRLFNPAVTSASKTSNGINVKWSKVTGATGYVVYRKTAKGSWSRIANIKSGSTTSYTDTKASRGVTYIYTVRAYNGSTMSSFNSTKSARR